MTLNTFLYIFESNLLILTDNKEKLLMENTFFKNTSLSQIFLVAARNSQQHLQVMPVKIRSSPKIGRSTRMHCITKTSI